MMLDHNYFAHYRVTSTFIIEGILNRLRGLSKLNLSRTSVDDEGNKYNLSYNHCIYTNSYYTYAYAQL